MKSIPIPALVDMLAAQMQDYYMLCQEESVDMEKFARCSLAVKAIQQEIETRAKNCELSTNESSDYIDYSTMR